MHKLITASVVGLVLAAPLSAEAAVSDQEVAELKRQVQALLGRVQQLEARNGQPAAVAPASGTAKVEALEAGVAQTGSANDQQTDQLAQVAARDRRMDWASKLKIKGDFRYRHEMIDQQAAARRDRQRIRARLGLEAKVSDTISAGFQIATGTPDDPRSTNATLTDSNQRKGIQLDLAYVDWKAFADATITAGKQKYPWYRPGGSLFYDGDVNPEGVAVKLGGKTGPFASAWGLWLSEVGSGDDASVAGAQLGWAMNFGLTLALTYQDFGAIQNSSLSFADYPAGNSTFDADSSCNLPAPASGATRCYLYDYNILGLSAEYATKIGSLPFSVWGDYIENQDPRDLNTGYDVGIKLGKAGDRGSWELGLLYQDVEADAQWGGWVDSDFAAGTTQGKGIQLKGGWAPVDNVVLNLSFFDNRSNYELADERDYQRWQFDFNLQF